MDEKIQVIGQRVLVEKEKIDCGGLKLTPAVEEDGQKNKGKIISVGQLPHKYTLLGVKEGAKILFKKHFTANMGMDDSRLFVDLDEIMAVL